MEDTGKKKKKLAQALKYSIFPYCETAFAKDAAEITVRIQ